MELLDHPNTSYQDYLFAVKIALIYVAYKMIRISSKATKCRMD